MAKRYKNFQPVMKSSTRFSFSGLLAVVAVEGMIVNRNSAAEDTLELSTGKAGFFLRQGVCADLAALKAYLDTEALYPGSQGYRTPVVAGGAVQCEDFQSFWVEGSALLDANMDNTVAVGAPVTSAASKIKAITDSTAVETLGIVRRIIPAKNAGTGLRFNIEVARSAKPVAP